MNLYATIDDVKDLLNETGSDRDTRIMMHLQTASRMIEAYCHRVFWTEIGTRYFDGRCGRVQYVDDFLSLTSVTTDSEQDNTFDGETWVDGTDYTAWPDNSWPKFGVAKLPDGNYAWRDIPRYIKATGTWGYGDGSDGTPWSDLGETITLASTTTTSGTLGSSDGLVKRGHTLLVGDEQIYVSNVSGTTATVMRGMNGTTATTHNEADVSAAVYPALIVQTCATLATTIMERATKLGMESERIGDYSYKLANDSVIKDFIGNALGTFVRPVI